MAAPRTDSKRRGLSPAAESIRDLPLLLLCLAAAASSIAALLFHVWGWIRMPYTISFVTFPGTVLMVGLVVWSSRTSRTLLFNRLFIGLIAGAAGLVAYDGIRLLTQTLLPVHYDAFYSMKVFGYLMTGKPITSTTALLSGWAYHVSNGFTFAIAYSLVAGPARWWWGLAWGLALEIAMLLVYPSLFHLTALSAFVIVSVVGHAAYGATLGVMCERYAMRPAR